MYKPLDYWYDAQQRRFLEQIVLAFSGFQVMTGWSERNGQRIPPRLVQVPCTMAVTDRQVGAIMRNNTANTLLTCPRITVWQTDLQFRRADLQNPNHVDTRQVVERVFDENTGKYVTGTERGRSSTVFRLMPLPFEMTIQVDIWTSSLEQKYQLIEQIATVSTPDFAIQNSDNPIDWTAMTTCQFDNMNWSSRSIPAGTDDEIDIMSLTFKLPFWLSPPVKVTQQNVIEEVITNIHDIHVDDEGDLVTSNPVARDIVTPGDHVVAVEGNSITLLGPSGNEFDTAGATYTWASLFNLYNTTLRPTLSTLRLKTNPEQIDDWSYDLVGAIQIDPSAPNRLIWTIDPDTLPANTLDPIDGLIDPLRRFPGNGLPSPATGQRYLLTNDIGPSQAWGNVTASANSIIQYTGSQWALTYAPPIGVQSAAYVHNLGSGEQIRWNGEDWVKTIDGIYPPGYWRFRL